MRALVRVRYKNPKNIIWYLFFAISFINVSLLSAWLLMVLLWAVFSKNESNKVKAFLMIQFRTLINPGIGVPFSGSASIIKWLAVFLLSITVFLIKTKTAKPLKKVFLAFILYALYLVGSAWITSSYPVVASFKIIAYIVPFLAIVKGIQDTEDTDWIREMLIPLGILLFASVVLLPTDVGYLRNGYAFQGLFNHPNVYGVMLAMFLAGYYYTKSVLDFRAILITALVLALAVLSGSRTGMFSCIIALVCFVFSKTVRSQSKTVFYSMIVLCVALAIITLNNRVYNAIIALVFKGHFDSLVFSRIDQIASNLDHFKASPMLGTGFNVPYLNGVRSYSFSFDLVVENGNLILALLGDTGIIGTVFFILCYALIVKLGWGTKLVIFAIPFAVSMGEQSFFSTNNFGIIMYFFIAIYLSNGLQSKNNFCYSRLEE